MTTKPCRTALVAGLLSLALASSAVADRDHRNSEQRSSAGRDSSHHVRRAPDRPTRYPPVGREVHRLPANYSRVVVGRDEYRYNRGVFYRPRRDGVYLVVRPPLGARVSYLPAGYVSFGYGPSRYFYYDTTYYLWDQPRREYVVVQQPEGAPAAVAAAAQETGELFVYPKQGQSDEQRERDRYDCYLWGAQQTGFDPGADEPEMDKSRDYRRALSACLEGRGYTVK